MYFVVVLLNPYPIACVRFRALGARPSHVDEADCASLMPDDAKKEWVICHEFLRFRLRFPQFRCGTVFCLVSL